MSGAVIQSRDGTRIATVSAGNPSNPAILLIHGWAQQSICWQDLMERLSDRFYLVAMDLRGHGASGKPTGAEPYTDTKLWAEDVAAVMDLHDLSDVSLVGWSYGARVIAAYLSEFGEGNVAGVVLAGGIAAIGAPREKWMVGEDNPALERDLYTSDPTRCLAATARFVDSCTTDPLPRATYGAMVGANMLCPSHVRRALFGADVDLRPVFTKLSKPGLIIHGDTDRIVTPSTGAANAEAMPNARLLSYEGVGHVPFLEAPERFANDLSEFTSSLLTNPDLTDVKQ